MRISSALVAAAAATLLLAGCSSGSDQSSSPTQTSSTAGASAAPSATSAEPSATASPSTASTEPSGAPEPGSSNVSAADGALTWTMPCATVRDQEIQGNEQDKQQYSSFHGWACGTGKNTTVAVFLVQLVKQPADDDAAHRELQGAAEQVVKGSKPKHDTFKGHPSVSMQATSNGRTVAFRGVSFDDYLVLFMARGSDNLDQILKTVEIS